MAKKNGSTGADHAAEDAGAAVFDETAFARLMDEAQRGFACHRRHLVTLAKMQVRSDGRDGGGEMAETGRVPRG